MQFHYRLQKVVLRDGLELGLSLAKGTQGMSHWKILSIIFRAGLESIFLAEGSSFRNSLELKSLQFDHLEDTQIPPCSPVGAPQDPSGSLQRAVTASCKRGNECGFIYIIEP